MPSTLHDWLALPMVGLAVAIVLTVIGARLTTNSANGLLIAAWVLATASIFVLPFVAQLDVIPRILWTAMFASVTGLGLYQLRWAEPVIAVSSKTEPQSTSPLQTQDGTKAKLDEITDLLKAQGATASQKTLLAKYPLGYRIFALDYTNAVFPYQSQAATQSQALLEQYEFDWSVVKYTKNTADQVEIMLPNARRKDGTVGTVRNAVTGGKKQVGELGGYFIGELSVFGEILAIEDKGIVFLVGFERAPQIPRKAMPPIIKKDIPIEPKEIIPIKPKETIAAVLIKKYPVPSQGIGQSPDRFISEWLNRINKVRSSPKPDLLAVIQQKIARLPTGANPMKEFVAEATFTLRCLASEGYVRIKETTVPGRWLGEDFPNLEFEFVPERLNEFIEGL